MWEQFGSDWSQEWRTYTAIRESEAWKGQGGPRLYELTCSWGGKIKTWVWGLEAKWHQRQDFSLKQFYKSSFPRCCQKYLCLAGMYKYVLLFDGWLRAEWTVYHFLFERIWNIHVLYPDIGGKFLISAPNNFLSSQFFIKELCH